MTRHEKLNWLLETCTSKHIQECTFLTELVNYMSEDAFDKFYERHCSNWQILQPDDDSRAMVIA